MNTPNSITTRTLRAEPAAFDYGRFEPSEVLSAAGDFLAASAGRRPDRPHPLADTLSFRDIAYALAVAREPRRPHESGSALMFRGLSTPEFMELLIDSHLPAVLSVFNGASAEYSRFTAPVEVADFKEVDSRAFDGDVDPRLVGELSEITYAEGLAPAVGSKLQLRTYARVCWLHRDWLLSDDLLAIAGLFRSIGAGGARVETRLVTELLTSNPVMPDEAAMFDSSNTVAQALDDETLGIAMKVLRQASEQPDAALNLAAKHLVVAPELELSANKLVHEAGLGIEVSALADLPAGRWFLLPDPDLHPVIGRLRLRGSSEPLVLVGAGRRLSDRLAVKVRLDTNAAFLRRTGIIRGGADL